MRNRKPKASGSQALQDIISDLTAASSRKAAVLDKLVGEYMHVSEHTMPHDELQKMKVYVDNALAMHGTGAIARRDEELAHSMSRYDASAADGVGTMVGFAKDMLQDLAQKDTQISEICSGLLMRYESQVAHAHGAFLR